MHLFSLPEIKGDITHLPTWLDNRGNILCEDALLSTLNKEGAATFWLFYHRFFFFFSLSKGFPGDSDSKESACNAGDLGSIPRLGDTLEKGMAT